MQDISRQVNLKEVKLEYIRDGIGEALVEAGEINKNVFVLCADLTESTRASMFKQRFPSRFVEVGVSEQNLIGVSVGLSMINKVVFALSFAVFSPGRTWDQIRVNVCYNNANVKIIGGHAGLTTGADGATHQALEDISIMRVLPNMTVIVPCDKEQARKATVASSNHIGPVYVRGSRDKSAVITNKNTPFEIGVAQVLAHGKDVLIIACGIMVYEALIAREELLKQGVSCSVVNLHTIKPIDKQTLVYLATQHKFCLVCEEHQINGGLFGAVSELLSSLHPIKTISIGVKDSFGESGEARELLKKYQIDSSSIINTIMDNFRKSHFFKESYICKNCLREYNKAQKCEDCGIEVTKKCPNCENPKDRCICC